MGQLVIDVENETQDPIVASLDLSVFSENDYLNLILQRSEVLFDVPKYGRIIKAWSAGDAAPIEAVVVKMGDSIARRVAGVIHAEYRAISALLEQIAPKRIADIGCGYAFFVLFAARAFKAESVLIDLEANERRQFGYKPEGAAYSSLTVARKLLEMNGVPSSEITTVNPRDRAPETVEPVDLIVSFLSCGFHYPVDTYLPFLETSLKPGGSAIFDLRDGTADKQAAQLAKLGELTYLDAPPKARRVLLRKTG